MRSLQFFVGILAIGLISGCSDTLEDILWVDGESFEPSVFDQLYICRVRQNGTIFVGSYVAAEATKFCLVNHNDGFQELKSFEVLECAASGIWTPTFGNILPSNVYSLGVDQPVYACKDVNGNPAIGVVKELPCSSSDVSCVKEVVCEVLVFGKLAGSTVELDKFTVFSTTNIAVETDISKESEHFDLKEPLQIRMLSFNVKSKEQASLLLREESGTTLFEILIGGLQNSITAIRKGGYQMFSNTAHTMSILDEDNYVSFYVHWGKGVLIFGRANKYLEPALNSTMNVISLKDSGVFGIKKFSVKSSSESTWSF